MKIYIFGRMYMKLFAVLLVLIIGIIFFFNNCSAFGKNPSGEHLKKISESNRFDKERKEFVNRDPNVLDEMQKKAGFWKPMKEFFFGGSKYSKPKEKLPELKPDLEYFTKKSESIKFIWFGHSTFLLNLNGKILFFDPVFSESAAPFSFMIKRFQDAVIKLEELPEIDYILISHDHYDHLDENTIKFFKNKKVKFITPLGVSSHLKYWGIEEDRLIELDYWQSFISDELEIFLTPSQHFSGRGLSQNKTLWGSYSITSGKKKIYYSGDSGYDVHFKEIGEKFNGFDLSFIENGQYSEHWKAVHVMPEETAQAYFDLKSKALVPVHWGMFDLSLHSWYEPAERIEQESIKRNINLLTPKFGQVVDLQEPNAYERWWKKLISSFK